MSSDINVTLRTSQNHSMVCRHLDFFLKIAAEQMMLHDTTDVDEHITSWIQAEHGAAKRQY